MDEPKALYLAALRPGGETMAADQKNGSRRVVGGGLPGSIAGNRAGHHVRLLESGELC